MRYGGFRFKNPPQGELRGKAYLMRPHKMTSVEHIIRENARRNAEKKRDYDPLRGVGCYGNRFELFVPEYSHLPFYFPNEMSELYPIRLLKKHKSIAAAIQAITKVQPNKDDISLFWLRLCELRYQYDFEFYAAACLIIRDKLTGADIPFVLNRGQRKLLKTLEKQRTADIPIRVQLLKARQWGGSTLAQMYMNWIQIIHKQNWNSVICAHVKDAAINVRAMYDNSIRKMQAINGVQYTIKPFQQTQNIKEVPESGCRITVGTAVEPESVRSQDVKMVHFSEMALYPATQGNNPELLEASIVSSIPNTPYTLIVRESTANGVGDYFYEQWQKAKAGETVFEPVFVEWYLIDMYSAPFDNSYFLKNGKKKKGGTVAEFINTLDEYELNLWNNHKECTLENINWRRQMAATMPSETKMRQEFPSDDIEAFQDSGSPAFKAEDVEKLRKDCCKPEFVGTLSAKVLPDMAVIDPKKRADILKQVEFILDTEATDWVRNGDQKTAFNKGLNKLHIWEMPDKEQRISDRYVVTFDPQRGTSDTADYGVIKVFDRYWMMYGEKPSLVATFYGHIDKDITLWIAAQVAVFYDNALLVVESNTYDQTNSGGDETEFIFDMLAEHYDNLYSRTPADKIRENAPIRYGFQTNKNTKPMLINNYIGIIREQSYIERDEETLNEARTYEQKKDGSYGAKAGKHDDRIMATMIGLYICYNLPIPKEIKKGGNKFEMPKRVI